MDPLDCTLVPSAWWDQRSESLHAALHDFTRRSGLLTWVNDVYSADWDTECCSIVGRLTQSNQLKLTVLRRILAHAKCR